MTKCDSDDDDDNDNDDDNDTNQDNTENCTIMICPQNGLPLTTLQVISSL